VYFFFFFPLTYVNIISINIVTKIKIGYSSKPASFISLHSFMYSFIFFL
jgi:hypothetical protein